MKRSERATTSIIACVLMMIMNATSVVIAQPITAIELRKASVRTQQATFRIETGTNRSSGVLISPDGHILTVAHGLQPSDINVDVIRSDHTKLSALVLFRDPVADVAVLQIAVESRQKLPQFLSIRDVSAGAATPKSRNAVVLAVGYPARETRDAGPVVRLGTIAAITKKHLRTTCGLTVGDSGGALVDGNGDLIGINARIGLGRASNLHLSVSSLASVLRTVEGLRETATPPVLQNMRTIFNRPAVVDQTLNCRTVHLYLPGNPDPICTGTLLNRSTVVSKLSELGSAIRIKCETSDGHRRIAELVARDEALDVAILTFVDAASPIDLDPRCPANVFEVPGSSSIPVHRSDVVYSGQTAVASIVARTDHSEAKAQPKLGCTLATAGAELLIESVAPNSAAADAQLKPGDRLLKLADFAVTTLDEVATVIHRQQPGDMIRFVVRRKADQLTASGRLRFPPEFILDQTEYLDGRSGVLSRRRTGFAHVIQHDAALSPADMGGPLVNGVGELIGINIARRSRESVLAIPISAVQSIVAKSRVQPE